MDIQVTSRNGAEYAIYQKNEQTSLENKEVKPVEPDQIDIY